MRHSRWVRAAVPERPANARWAGDAADVACRRVALDVVVFVAEREAAVGVDRDARDASGFILAEAAIRIILDELDDASVRAMCPDDRVAPDPTGAAARARITGVHIRGAERQFVVEAAAPVAPEHAHPEPLPVVDARDGEPAVGIAGKVDLHLDLVAGTDDDGVTARSVRVASGTGTALLLGVGVASFTALRVAECIECP